MIEKLSKYSIVFFIVIFIAFVFIGYLFLLESPLIYDSLKTFDVSLDTNDLFKIMFNNLLIGVLILFGFLTFNLTNLSFIVFNGLIYGIAINKFSVEFGLLKTLLAIAPHGIVEYFGLAILFSSSVEINISIYQYFNKSSINLVNTKTFKKILLGFSLIVFSSLIEVYLTPLIL